MKSRKLSIFILLITLVLSAVIGFVGCSEEEDENPTTVSVTFDLGYAPISEPQTKTVSLGMDESSETLSSLGVTSTRLGYDFLGYYDSQVGGVQIFDKNGNQAFAISADITLYAQWSIITYQKTFTSKSANANAQAVEPLQVKIGATISTLPKPVMVEGFEFIGWATAPLEENGTLVSNGVTVKGEYRTVSANNASLWLNNSEFTAIVDVCKYTVTLMDYKNNDNNDVKVFNYNTTVTDLPILEDDDEKKIEFVGWSTDLYNYRPYTEDSNCQTIKKDQILYAFYYEYRYLEFYKDSSSDFVPVKIYNTTDFVFEMPDIPNPGKELVGWYQSKLFNTKPITQLTYGHGITKLYGKWNIIDYTASFDLNGGSVVESGDLDVDVSSTEIDDMVYNVESEVVLPILQKDRFTFKGWYRSDDDTKTLIHDIEPGMFGDVTLVAKFEGDKRKVVYHVNEGSLGVTHKFVEYYENYKLDVPTSDVYGFFGWYLDENLKTQLTDTEGYGVSSPKWTSYDEETHVYAKFLEKRYVILTGSHANAGSVELKDHYVEGEIVSIEVVPQTQYSVDGIMINGVKVASGETYEFTMPADDVMLHVLYKPKTYTITLKLHGEDEYCSKTSVVVEYGEFYTLPVAFKELNRFIGWEYVEDDYSAEILTNADGTSKQGYLFTNDLTVYPFYAPDNENKDIIIKNEADFISIKDDPTATYQLVTDLNMSGRKWEPFDFSGTLNGNGYKITNFSINTDSGNVAMFNKLTGTVDGITFSNVNLISSDYNGSGVSVICYNLDGGSITNCVIESGKVEGQVGYAAGFASLVTSGTINNCVNKASIETDTTHTSDSYAIGGIAGFVYAGTITNCSNYGAIKGAEFVGGIVGRSQGSNAGLTLNYLTNYGSVTGTDSFVAGIIGRFDRDYDYSITDLTNTGKIEGVSYVGGLLGYWENNYSIRDNNARKVVANAFENSGTIIAEGSYVGGLIGRVYFDAPYNSYYSDSWNGTIALIMKQSKNTGDVTGGLYVGGLLGSGVTDTSVSVIENGINNSKVTANARVGGLAGELTTINLVSPSNLGSTITATETSIENGAKYVFMGGYVGRADNCDIESATNSSAINYSSTSCEGNYVGGIAGWSTGTFTNCKNTATINAPKSSYVGGIAGQLSKIYNYSIKNVGNSGNVIGVNYVAGIFGDWHNNYSIRDNNARVTNAIGFENSGTIKGSGDYVGGLMGNVYFDAPYNSYYSDSWNGTIALVMRSPKNMGDVEGKLYVGGLIGKVVTDSSNSLIEEGVSSANITATAIVGGIAGETATIKLVETSNRNSTITVLGTYDSGSSKYAYVGGYIGYAGDTHIVTAVNDVEIDYSATLCVGGYLGGFTGFSSGTFENCVNNATIYAPKSSYVGGISGRLSKAYGYDIKGVKNTGNITGTACVAGIFGEWYNEYTQRDNNARVVNVIGVENSGTIKGSGNYAGGLFGNVYFDAPYNSYYSDSWNGTIGLVVKEGKNTGDVEGAYYVGGIAGRTITDSSQSNFIEVTSEANVKATALVGGMFGEAKIIKLTATSNEGSTVTATGTLDESTNKYAYVGGYVGRAYDVTIAESVNEVEIDYSQELCLGMYVGGFTGYSQGVFTNVVNSAKVYAPNSNYVGGISGRLDRAYAYTIEKATNNGEVSGKNYVAGIFGYWQNVHTTRDSSARIVDANSITNNGNITASENYVGGLMGYVYFDAPYNSYYSDSWNGQQILYMKDAVNSGNVQGTANVGGLMGYCSTDSTTSQIFTCTQTGVITGVEKANDLIGEYANVILPEIVEEE